MESKTLMEMTTDEILISHNKWSYIKTDRNGTRYFSDSTCRRCGGRGIISCYGYIEGGKCFKCLGSGIDAHPEVIKVYTPDYAAKLEADRTKRAEKKHNEKIEQFKRDINANFVKMGFGIEDETPVLYRVIGDTYHLKEELKQLGCKFNYGVGWYSPINLDNYETQRMTADEVVNIDYDAAVINWLDPKDIKPKWKENLDAPESTSEWVGEIGDREVFELHIDRRFDSGFRAGYRAIDSYLYLLHDAKGNVFKWNSTHVFEVNSDIRVKATIKEHAEYTDNHEKIVKQTVITRGTVVKD